MKDIIVKRFGDSTSNGNRVKNFLSLLQNRNEPIRDYMDRYYAAFIRLPGSNNDSMIQTALFIKSLQHRTRDEIEKHLKENFQSKNDSFYPETFDILFDYLTKYMGDIQETLYNLTINSSKNNKPNSDYDNNHKCNKEKLKNDDIDIDNTQKTSKLVATNKPLKNACSFCKIAEYTKEHRDNCIEFYKSPYYRKLMTEKDKPTNNENNNKVQVFFNNKNEPNTHNIYDIYRDIDNKNSRNFELRRLQTLRV